MRQHRFGLIWLWMLLPFIAAVRFDLAAEQEQLAVEKCLYQFVPMDTQVYLTIEVGDGYNQRVDVLVKGDEQQPTVYYRKKSAHGRLISTFNSVAEGNIAICVTNALDSGFMQSPEYSRWVDIKVEVGAEAKFETIVQTEKLGPMELELRRLEAVVKEIIDEMQYLKGREAEMRNTNGKSKATRGE
ncbi:hypothetical protein DM01DRAFT_251897 [Hesseltinella vesiculosa]|uniref:GOLD domain-containing protein n=1 Tax=Hesseltinella vesiculosa TaxID=101127 RepID=A0A1X2GW84_9FUNG|nr:hypothetical protein DM01DRAFT_251897 [Hesseltinella vesiculosa]